MREAQIARVRPSPAQQNGKIIVVSDDCKTMTVRLDNGIMGQGDMPLQWRSDNEYDLLAGGRVMLRKLP